MAGLPRRIIKETQCLLAEPVPGIKAEPDVSNARYFHVVIAGPQICTVLLSTQALLSAPNPDDPLADDVAKQRSSGSPTKPKP
ncbi:hypothetical protein J1605_011662 [Eschrichtius robustus]|uniref:Uncharacterized protein n=1 Tax=Eschrichtius robustus TaxID=9764 RepID=A0AB34GMR7_ESCRO|nr:hypothetical protein J1605_011662 [Eschrichtius robustus]